MRWGTFPSVNLLSQDHIRHGITNHVHLCMHRHDEITESWESSLQVLIIVDYDVAFVGYQGCSLSSCSFLQGASPGL